MEASEAIIDAEWTVVVEVAQPRSIVARDVRQEQERRAAEMRLYADDVTKCIEACLSDRPRPYLITREMRVVMADQIDEMHGQIAARADENRQRRYQAELRQATAAAQCAPSRQKWY